MATQTIKKLFATILALALLTPVLAQDMDGGLFTFFDTDDGDSITRAEFLAGVFGFFDTDTDSGLAEEEFLAGMGLLLGEEFTLTFHDFDFDANGIVTLEEFAAVYDAEIIGEPEDATRVQEGVTGVYEAELFGVSDADEDDELTMDELMAGLFGRIDANDDDVILLEEFGPFEGWFGRFGYGFDRLDQDRDGQLTQDEFRVMF